MISEGFDLIKLFNSLYVFVQTGLSKQCRLRLDAAERDISSGSTLFATHLNKTLFTFTDGKMGLLKRSFSKE